MKIAVLLLLFTYAFCNVVEPKTSLNFPEQIKNCKLNKGGYLWQWIDRPALGFHGNTTMVAVMEYKCNPESLGEVHYMLKPFHGWDALFEIVAEKLILGWKYPDGSFYFTPSEKAWMQDVGHVLRRNIRWGTPVTFHFKRNSKKDRVDLQIFLKNQILKIRHKIAYEVPESEFKKVIDMVLTRAFIQTI